MKPGNIDAGMNRPASRSKFSELKSGLPTFGPGFGLRTEICEGIKQHHAEIGFLEITPENYLADVRSIEWLEAYGDKFPLISHSVSLSLGSVDDLNEDFLHQLRWFADHFGIAWISDHLSFSSVDGHYSYDLFPLPFTRQAARFVADRILKAQEIADRPLIIENIPYYISSPPGQLTESEFISTVAEYADCGLLLDINNLVVNSINHKFDALDRLKELPLDRVVQIHMAGHSRYSQRAIDNHGSPIETEVFNLLQYVLEQTSVNAIMIERDQNFPPFCALLEELNHIKAITLQANKSNTAELTTSDAEPTHSHRIIEIALDAKHSCDEPQLKEGHLAQTQHIHANGEADLSIPHRTEPQNIDQNGTTENTESQVDLAKYQRFFLKTWDRLQVPLDLATVLFGGRGNGSVPGSEWPGIDHTGLGVYAWLRDQTRVSTMISIFPCCVAVIGSDYHKVLHKYFKAHPPRDRDILKMGEAFPDFLAQMIDRNKIPPFLKELADYEQARYRLLSVQSKPVGAPVNIELDSFDFLANNRPLVVPGLELRSYQFPIIDLYIQISNRHATKTQELQFERQKSCLAIFPVFGRWEPQILSLSSTALELLSVAVEKKKTYLQLISTIAGKNAGPQELAAAIKLLKALHENHILVGFESVHKTEKTEPETWLDYHEAMRTQGAHQTLELALSSINAALAHELVAVDIGAGCGRDSLMLLQSGWKVIAVDANTTALTELHKVLQPEQFARFEILNARMEELEVPECNLVNASLSLPFCNPQFFDSLWQRITNGLVPGGIFCGHFFGPQDDWAHSVNVVSKDRLEKLLERFTVISLQESHGPLRLASGGYKQGHVFSVVAARKP